MKSIRLLLFLSVVLVIGFSFKPMPQNPDQKPITKIAFGSCNKQDLPQPLWNPIIDDRPDLWIWMGDNIYGDSPIMDTLRAKYERQNAHPDYARVLAQIPIVGIWDDHDYGRNDAGKYFAQKKASRDLMFDFVGIPANAPERNREGGYSSHVFGTDGEQVKVVLLDARYFRDTLERVNRVYQPNPEGGVLGDPQWAWLEKELRESSARINLIVSGIQFLPTEHAYEKWANFPTERERLLDLIADSGVQNPILLSGDRHIAEIMQLKDTRFPKGIYEITSSGLTHTWSGAAEEANQFRVGELIAKLNYGFATIDWENHSITFEIKGEGGTVYASQRILLD